MRDATDKLLEAGDSVLFMFRMIGGVGAVHGTVLRFTPKRVIVQGVDGQQFTCDPLRLALVHPASAEYGADRQED